MQCRCWCMHATSVCVCAYQSMRAQMPQFHSTTPTAGLTDSNITLKDSHLSQALDISTSGSVHSHVTSSGLAIKSEKNMPPHQEETLLGLSNSALPLLARDNKNRNKETYRRQWIVIRRTKSSNFRFDALPILKDHRTKNKKGFHLSQDGFCVIHVHCV